MGSKDELSPELRMRKVTDFILGSRQTGKTTKAIAWMIQHKLAGRDAVMVCMDSRACANALRMARLTWGEEALDPDQFIPVHEAPRVLSIKWRNAPVVLEDLDSLLIRHLGRMPDAVTVTNER